MLPCVHLLITSCPGLCFAGDENGLQRMLGAQTWLKTLTEHGAQPLWCMIDTRAHPFPWIQIISETGNVVESKLSSLNLCDVKIINSFTKATYKKAHLFRKCYRKSTSFQNSFPNSHFQGYFFNTFTRIQKQLSLRLAEKTDAPSVFSTLYSSRETFFITIQYRAKTLSALDLHIQKVLSFFF